MWQRDRALVQMNTIYFLIILFYIVINQLKRDKKYFE